MKEGQTRERRLGAASLDRLSSLVYNSMAFFVFFSAAEDNEDNEDRGPFDRLSPLV